ncbi:Auxin response factor 15 [Zea mays]|uniref:Auxin response factor 15 n=1 Tax=Zea mays TaxID=4577 RepID=A0A3L6F036_MAIZE|nr:Auxin response factor 15 [Zea mays]
MATRFIDSGKQLVFDHATQFFTASIRTAAEAVVNNYICARLSLRYRHLMEDVLSLLPHVKKDNQDKVESKQSKGNTLNKLLELRSCFSCLSSRREVKKPKKPKVKKPKVKQRFSRMLHMFCKTLTASDTSTHVGFSVPHRAAEDCFPPLDYSQQRPSQELVAKDLHGTEWRFRHIYRALCAMLSISHVIGQPRRHLLTTGWSAFVNKKKLVSRDAVLFLRGDNGELRLGVRRAAQLKNGSAFPALYNQCSNLGSLPNVAHVVATKSVFHIYYNPRSGGNAYVIGDSAKLEQKWHAYYATTEHP